MKLEKIIVSQSIRLGKVSGKNGGSVYGLNLTKLCEQRYGFLQAPRTLDEYNLASGVTFLHGVFQDQFVIDKFQVFENGLLVEAKVDTQECEFFLDDVTKWATEQGGFSFIQEATAPKIFLSNIEVKSSASLSKTMAKLSSFGNEIAKVLRSYGNVSPDWTLSGLSFGNSAAGDVTSFRFEQREGTPPPKGIYFSSSRMRTKDHLRVLKVLEELL